MVAVPDTRRIILLDLNFTLVANSKQTWDYRFGAKVGQEVYRQWLVNLLRAEWVIMITARLHEQREETLAHIKALTDWEPQVSYFKQQRYQKAPDFKRDVMLQFVLPTYGYEMPYLALESNEETRAMYERLGIQAVRVPTDAEWDTLPDAAPPTHLGPTQGILL